MSSNCDGEPPSNLENADQLNHTDNIDDDHAIARVDEDVNDSGEVVETVNTKIANPEEGKEKTKKPPRSERKRRRHEEMLQQQKESRKQKKMDKKMRMKDDQQGQVSEDRKCNRVEQKAEIRRKCEEALKTGQKICIDCSLEQFMNDKEKWKLAMQLGRLYGSNKRADNPAHIYITGLNQGGSLYQECLKKNDGFLNYLIDRHEASHTELFPLDKIVYLSPDSVKVLSDIDPEKVYIIGGLVDESVTKNITKSRSDEAGISTARLPIEEHMERVEQTSYSKVLSVNQVFDILLTYLSTKSWKKALSVGVPRRKGYVVKGEDDNT